MSVVATGVSVPITSITTQVLNAVLAQIPASQAGIQNVVLNGFTSFTLHLADGSTYTIPLTPNPSLDFSDPRNSFYL